MSYPKNAASPERVDIGAVIQISDGAVQTSGVAIKVIPFGGAEASGGGTVEYSADGVVMYTPTQAETNYTSFILVASKSGCIPASKTVVTSASPVAGRTMPADGSVTAAVIADNAIDTATFAAGTTIPRCTLVDTTTTNTDMRGTNNAMLAASYTAPDNASITAIKAKTDNLPADPADQSAVEAAITAAQVAIIAQVDANETKIDSIQSDTNDIQGRLPAALESGRIAAALSTARGTQIDNIENAAGYTLAVLSGACADPQTASETYAITVFGSTFTVDMAGQTSTGTRTAPTLTKT